MNTEVTELMHQKEDYLKRIALADKIRQLEQTPLFKEIILQEFCINEAARYSATSGDINLSEDARKNASEISRAGGHLRRWLEIGLMQGSMARHNMAELEAAIEEAEHAEDTHE